MRPPDRVCTVHTAERRYIGLRSAALGLGAWQTGRWSPFGDTASGKDGKKAASKDGKAGKGGPGGTHRQKIGELHLHEVVDASCLFAFVATVQVATIPTKSQHVWNMYTRGRV